MNVSSVAASAPHDSRTSPAYQVALVAMLSVNFGILFFDRNALGFLMPFVQPDLHLSNTQVGLLSSALSFTWAFAALGIGIVSDKTGSRKGLLVATTVIFSACSFLSGLAASFAVLLGARLLMGVAEGGNMPISQSIIASEIPAQRRGIAMGVTQNFGSNLFGSFLAPAVLPLFAMAYGWRPAFFLAGVPGLVMALLLWKFLDRDAGAPLTPPAPAASAPLPRASLGAALANRNVVLCATIAVLLVSYFVVCLNFMPLYLVNVRHFTPARAGLLVSVLGISATIGAFVISGLSDRIGRRPLMLIMPLIAVILPLGALYYHGSVWMLAAIFFVGWGQTGVFPLFMATIPSESVPPLLRASALGLCMGSGELLGGVGAPFLAGLAADHAGLQAPLWIMVGLAVVGGLLALGLRETAPRVLARRAGAA